MKKLFLTAAAAILLVACGSSNDDGAGGPPPSAVTGPGGGSVPFGPADATVTKINAVVSNQAEDQPEIDVTAFAPTEPDTTEPVAI